MKTIKQYYVTSQIERKIYKNRYAEIPYVQHFKDDEGNWHEMTGTEDFSLERFRQHCVCRYVYRRTNQMNRGMKYIWECIGKVWCRTPAECGQLARKMFPEEKIRIQWGGDCFAKLLK